MTKYAEFHRMGGSYPSQTTKIKAISSSSPKHLSFRGHLDVSFFIVWNMLVSVKLTAWVSRYWTNLRNLREAPHAVAMGVGAGVFFGFTPLIGLKTLLAVAAAWLLGGSVVAAVIAVALHDVLLPLMPVVLRWEYMLGCWVLGNPHVFPPALNWDKGYLATAGLDWAVILNIGRPMLVGSLFFSVPFSCLSYGVMRFFLNRWRDKGTESKPFGVSPKHNPGKRD